MSVHRRYCLPQGTLCGINSSNPGETAPLLLGSMSEPGEGMKDIAQNIIDSVAAATINKAIGAAVSTRATAISLAAASASAVPSTEKKENDAIEHLLDSEGICPKSEGVEADIRRTSVGAWSGKHSLDAVPDQAEASGGAISSCPATAQRKQRHTGPGRIVYAGGPQEGSTVWLDGKREEAEIEVVERTHPHFELTISVKIKVGRATSGERSERDKHVWAKGVEGAQIVAASISLRKSDIKVALERWVFSSAMVPAAGMTLPNEINDRKRHIAAEKALHKWVSSGHTPRRSYLMLWLLHRLELVEADTEDTLSTEEGEFRARKYHLRLAARKPLDAEGFAKNGAWVGAAVGVVGSGASVGRNDRSDGDFTGEGGNGLKTAIGAESAVARNIVAKQSGSGNTVEGEESSCELGSTRGTGASDFSSSDGPSSTPAEFLPDKPTTPASPIDHDVHDAKSEAPEEGSYQLLDAPTLEGVSSVRSHPPLTAPGVGAPALERELRGPSLSQKFSSPSGCSVFGEMGQLERSDDRGNRLSGPSRNVEKENARASLLEVKGAVVDAVSFDGDTTIGIPRPPPHRRLFTIENSYTAPALRHIGERSIGHKVRVREEKPCWGANEVFDRQRERERMRRRRGFSRGPKNGCNGERPETASGCFDSSWRMTGQSNLAAMGDWQRRTPAGGRGRWVRGVGSTEGWSSRVTEKWNDGRWRLTRYLESCERKLTEAMERRRRVEANASAAKRAALITSSTGAGDKVQKPTWVRAASQRVLDLLLVTERVRREEKRRRVAAERVKEQVARCKQPFRERRGFSERGACVGPRVPPPRATDPPRDTRVENTMRKFYWDEHGRRYSRGGRLGDDLASGELEIALEIMRRVASACLEEGTDFRQPFVELDADGDGRLSLAEFGAALHRTGARLGLSQVKALFKYFSGDEVSDVVSRGDFLWEFVDKGRLLDQWRGARDTTSTRPGQRSRMNSLRERVKIRGVGVEPSLMSRNYFSRALEVSGVRVNGWEREALLDRFQRGDHGEIDWLGFVSVMQAAERIEERIQEEVVPPPCGFHRNDQRRPSDRHCLPNETMDVRRQDQQRGTPDRSARSNVGSLRRGRGDLHPYTFSKQKGNGHYVHGRLFDASNACDSSGSALTTTPKSGGLHCLRASTTDAMPTYLRRSHIISGYGSPLITKPSSWEWASSRASSSRRRELLDVPSVSWHNAARVLDDCLEGQEELEAFLEEEIAKRAVPEESGVDW